MLKDIRILHIPSSGTTQYVKHSWVAHLNDTCIGHIHLQKEVNKSKKGNTKLAQMIQEKVLLKSQVTMGSGNVSDVLQMLETGELELEGEPIIIDNGDGTVTVKLVVKPR